MTMISSLSSTNSPNIQNNQTANTASGGNAFANEFMQVQQQLASSLPSNIPPSAYVARAGAYSVETHGSHIVNGVQLIPGAPGYNPIAAMPYLNQIVQTQQELNPPALPVVQPATQQMTSTPSVEQNPVEQTISKQDETSESQTTQTQANIQSISAQLSELSAKLVNNQPTNISTYLNQVTQIQTIMQQLSALEEEAKKVV
jgi:hypothetical protein